jgi:hypothetical protein
MSTTNLRTVLNAVSVMRAVARTLLPSTRDATRAARRSVLNLFMVRIMAERSAIVKGPAHSRGQRYGKE